MISGLGLLFIVFNYANASADWRQANIAIVQQHVLPAYESLVQASEKLIEKSEALCDTADARSLESLRSAFHQTVDAWALIQHLRSGPIMLFDYYYRYQLWPDKHNVVGRQLRKVLTVQDRALLQYENLQRSSVAVQGLSALERLLFGKKIQAEVFGRDNPNEFRCKFIITISQNLASMSRDIAEVWALDPPPYHMIFLAASERQGVSRQDDQSLADDKSILIAFYNNIPAQLQFIVNDKLFRPLRTTTAKAKPRYLEFWRSQRALRNLKLNIQAIKSLYDTGFSILLERSEQGARLDKEVQQVFTHIKQALTGVDAPLYEKLKDETQRAKQEALLEAVRRLQSLMLGPVPRSLGFPLRFNAFDGD